MSKLLILYSRLASIEQSYFPAINLEGGNWCIGLTSITVYNSIPNIDKSNNTITVGSHEILIPEGSYEIDEINECVNNELKKKEPNHTITIRGNSSTLRSEIESSLPVYVKTLGPLLGFREQKFLKAGEKHVSDSTVDILKVHDVRVECNIVQDNFINNVPSNTIFGFDLNVPPGFKLSINPQTVIYYPVSVDSVSNLVVRIVDQNGDLINFRDELITIYLHLKKST